jgi:hypothetical protein
LLTIVTHAEDREMLGHHPQLAAPSELNPATIISAKEHGELYMNQSLIIVQAFSWD